MTEFELEKAPLGAIIKVVGVGGAGGNTINSMIDAGYEGIEFIVANTDAQALAMSKASVKIQLGVKSTKGLGSGANPDLGRRAAEEDLDKVLDEVGEADIVFLSGGMGGGTGSGALPVIAKALKASGILTVSVVTKPFAFEGKRRARIAESAIDALRKEVDTLIVIPNQKLLEVVDQEVSMIDAFARINEVLNQAVKGISDIITKPGHINVDFADMREIMHGMGMAVLGTGSASGTDRARHAAEQAISSPLLENMSIAGAKGVLINISGGANLGLHELSQAASVIYELVDEDANIIIGSVIDKQMGDAVSVTVIATGFNRPAAPAPQPALATDTKQLKAALIDACIPQESSVPSATLTHDEIPTAGPMDVNNLDVPTFLRKQMQG
jgi:cell division protein FtsZ